MDPKNMPQPKEFTAKEAFGVLDGPKLQGYDRPWNTPTLKTPRRLPNYQWDVNMLRLMILFFFAGRTAMKFIGHTGVGKTMGVNQFHACLNLPLLEMTVNPETKAVDLIGRYIIGPSGLEWRDGPVLLAARHGLSICINEYNLLDPGEGAGLNAFLDGQAYTVVETGETVVPAPGFRVWATENPKGFGYSGRNVMEISNTDRFKPIIKVNYPSADEEERIIVDELTRIGQPVDASKDLAKLVVTGANAVRDAFVGHSDNDDAVPCIVSRRGAVEWARWCVFSQSIPDAESPFYRALDLTLCNAEEADVREAVRKIVHLKTGVPFQAAGGAS